MRLYDNQGNVYVAHAEKRPSFTHGVFGRTWDIKTDLPINGEKVEMVYDTTWGNWFHFELNGRWYRLRIYATYNSDELGAHSVNALFTDNPMEVNDGE